MAAAGGAAMRLPPMASLKDILHMYRIRASKHLSQNFLLNTKCIHRIVKVAGKLEGGFVMEVGPGPGGITRAILERGASRVVVVEKDPRFLPSLEQLRDACDKRLTIYQDDILKFNTDEVFPKELAKPWHHNPPKINIIANLPFNIASPLIIKWLRDISRRTGPWESGRVRMTLTFQKEVAQRLASEMKRQQRSRLSIMSQYLCEVTHKFDIPGSQFVPPPDVDVGVVHFLPRVEPLIDVAFPYVEKVVRHTFHYRQKMCKRGIQTLFPPDRPDLAVEMIRRADIDPGARPFTLTVEEFGRLSEAYKLLCDQQDGLLEYDYRSKENAKDWNRNLLKMGL